MSDEQLIRHTIKTYFDSMYESDADKAFQAFHPNAKITGYLNGQLVESSVKEFAERVGSRTPSEKEQGLTPLLEILSIEIAGDTAVARVRDVYLGLLFLDTLSLLRSEGQWRIYNKLFHVEGDA